MFDGESLEADEWSAMNAHRKGILGLN
jgi:hypothetical protein